MQGNFSHTLECNKEAMQTIVQILNVFHTQN